MITEKEIAKIKELLDNTHRPLIFFDDDPDGLCSFLMIYKYIGDGRGIPIKTSPDLSAQYLNIVNDYGPDRIIILDKPLVSNEFITKTKVPILWIDHHPIPEESKKVDYFNPLKSDETDNSPTSYWIYKIINDPKYMWLGMIGTVSDWFIPDFSKEFSEENKEYFDDKITSQSQALFETKIGRLGKIFYYCLKGTSTKVKSCIKILTRINTPYEILDETTAQGKFIMKHAKKLDERYEVLLKNVNEKNKDFVEFNYNDQKMSFTAMYSNELQHRYPNKFIIVAREKNGYMHCSLRSQTHDVRALLDKIIKEFAEGYGGGHMHACGANVKEEDFGKFLDGLRKLIP